MTEVFNVQVGEIASIPDLPELDTDLNVIAQSEVAAVAVLAQQALKTAAPVYTGALRNSVTIESDASSKRVVIQERDHYSGFGTEELADILDRGPYRRRQTSVREGPFASIQVGSPTADWIAKAQDDLEAYLT